MSADDLARAVGFPRHRVSQLENAQRGPDIDLPAGICEFLHVCPRRRDAILAAASDGWSIGWWEADAAAMGARQAVFADLASGTDVMWEYALGLIPGLLQTPQFADARVRSDPARQPGDFDPAAAVAARSRRQALLLAPGGPRYELVLDELPVQRQAAEPPVVAAQLRHIIELCSQHHNVVVRILPISGDFIKGHSAPPSAYTLFRYRDEHATLAVAATTLTSDHIYLDPIRIEAYRELHSRLTVAALSPAESVALLIAVADRIDPVGGNIMDPEFVHWHKSSRSDGSGNCVEVSESVDGKLIGVRDTKNRNGGTLTFDPKVWSGFLDDLRTGVLDD